MNRFILYIMACLTLIGCSDTYDESLGLFPMQNPHFLGISDSLLIFDANPQQKQSLTVHSIQTPWQFINNSKWITLSAESENVTGTKTTCVDVLPLENTSCDTTRTHIILLESMMSDWNISTPVKIFQKAALPHITPNQTSVSLSGRSQTTTIGVRSNVNWDVETSQPWIDAKRNNDELVINVECNDTRYARSGIVSLLGSVSSFIMVEQERAGFDVKLDTIFFDRFGGTYTLAVETDFTLRTYTYAPWIQVSPEKVNAGEDKIEVSVTPNNSMVERIGRIYVAKGALSFMIPVLQRCFHANTNINNIEFGSHGGTMSLSVSSNDSWKACLDNNDWLTLTEKTGKESKEIILTAKDNPFATSRSMSLLLDFEVCDDISLDIVQKPRYLTTSQNTIAFFGKGGTENLHITTDGLYRIEKNGDWFTVSQNGDDLVVSAPENDTKAWRNGSIVITMTDLKDGELSVTIPIEQSYGGKTIDKSDYDNDADWNDDKSEWSVKISVVGYKTDEDWSTNPEKSESTISIGEYAPDVDETSGNTPSSISRVLYDSSDANWSGNPDQTNSCINHPDYSDDEDWTNKE